MFEKSALLMICCDISNKSFENVHLTCENSTKANKKNCSNICEFKFLKPKINSMWLKTLNSCDVKQ